MRLILAIFTVLLLFPVSNAQAQISGQIQYNGGWYEYYNGTTWLKFARTAGAACLAPKDGQLSFNSINGTYEYCTSGTTYGLRIDAVSAGGLGCVDGTMSYSANKYYVCVGNGTKQIWCDANKPCL